MGSLANSLFRLMLGWLQGIVAAVWSGFTTEEGGSFFAWIGDHWILIAVILCIIGLVSDLCVYLLRWKPFRKQKGVSEQEHVPAERPVIQPVQTGIPASDGQMPDRDGSENRTSDHDDQTEPDFSRWQHNPRSEKPVMPRRDEIPATVTKAGYTVPADSPYRRPAERPEKDYSAATDTDEERIPERDSRDDRPAAITARSRRRVKISDLFSDPEEDLRQAEAPQHIIDSRKAYRDPVYPRGWQKDKGEG